MDSRNIQPRISFVILTWNSARYVERCLDSVLGIGDYCSEVFVVDNGSTDGTVELLRSLAAVDSRLNVVELDVNRGTTVSRNIALRKVSPKATHICILDSDTIVNRRAFDEMVFCLNTDPSIGVIGPAMVDASGKVQLSGRNLPTLGIKLGKAFPFGSFSARAAAAERPATVSGSDGLQDVGYLLSACWFMPRLTLERVGFLDERIFYAPEDVDWCLRCHRAGLRVCFCPGALIVHEYQRLSHKRLLSKTNVEHLKGLAYYFWKHRYLARAPRIEGLE